MGLAMRHNFADLNDSFAPDLFHSFAPDPRYSFGPDLTDSFYHTAGSAIYGSYIPSYSGSPMGLLPPSLLYNQGVTPTGGAATPGSVVSVTSGGITINLLFDAAAMAAPES